ncbi:MAG: hypothetical protein GY853_14050 [PVC group bacterium]|nr:hypothetical protein [PVC group bacterium]
MWKNDTKTDERTKKYLSKIKNNIGYMGCNSGEELFFADVVKKIGEEINVKEVRHNAAENETLYEYVIDGKKRYCLEKWIRYDIDGINCTTYIFTKKPSQKDCNTILIIESIELDIVFARLHPTYTCWECSHTTHWLDNGGETLEEKQSRAQDDYCGC